MSLRIHIFLLIGSLTLSVCTQKVVPTDTSDKEYYEDLSSFRPDISDYQESEHDSTEIAGKKEEIITPTLDVTEELAILMDSISKVNLETEYYEYTVQVHIGNNREAANQARLDVIRILPDVKPRLEYKSPSYRVKVGKYFNNVEAYQTYVRLKEKFPNAIIVPERVNFQ